MFFGVCSVNIDAHDPISRKSEVKKGIANPNNKDSGWAGYLVQASPNANKVFLYQFSNRHLNFLLCRAPEMANDAVRNALEPVTYTALFSPRSMVIWL